jgi:tetratricopeptide (TPR) repeat protein
MSQPETAATSGRPARPSRRRVLRLWSGLLLACVTAGLLGYLAWLRLRPETPPEPPLPEGVAEAEVRQALTHARQQVLAAPRSGAAWGRYGMVLLAQLFDHEADVCFAEAARLAPTNALWTYARGYIALKRRPDEAVALLRQAVQGHAAAKDLAAMRMQLAEALLDRGETAAAADLFARERQDDPGDLRAAFGLGLVALERGDDRGAEEELTAARNSPFARKKATARLAALARRRGDNTRAAELEKEAAELPADPPWPDPLLDPIMDLAVGHRSRERKVQELEQQGKHQQAAEEYLRQIDELPTARAYVGAGINLARLHDYDHALPLLRRAVELDPGSAQAQYTLALTLFTMAEKGWQTAPESQQVRAWFTDAVEHARRAAELKPDHAQAYLFWGLSLKYLGRPAEAVAPLQKGVACRPELFELQLALGEVLLLVGRRDEARTHLENARALDPNDPRPGRALDRLNKE